MHGWANEEGDESTITNRTQAHPGAAAVVVEVMVLVLVVMVVDEVMVVMGMTCGRGLCGYDTGRGGRDAVRVSYELHVKRRLVCQ